jgi:hypothetical protein
VSLRQHWLSLDLGGSAGLHYAWLATSFKVRANDWTKNASEGLGPWMEVKIAVPENCFAGKTSKIYICFQVSLHS